MTEERRKYKRVPGRLRITYKIEAEAIEGSAYSIDVSAGGFCIGMDQRIKNDTLIELLVYLPDNEKSFKCSARVSWQKMHGVKEKNEKIFYETGLRFEQLDLKNRLRLIYYVHGRTRKINSQYEKPAS